MISPNLVQHIAHQRPNKNYGHKNLVEFYDLTTLPRLFLLVSCYLGIRYWHRLSGPLKVLAVYLWFNLGIEAGARIMGILYSQNLPLLHLYTLGTPLSPVLPADFG